jgi:hypothetical protein
MILITPPGCTKNERGETRALRRGHEFPQKTPQITGFPSAIERVNRGLK